MKAYWQLADKYFSSRKPREQLLLLLGLLALMLGLSYGLVIGPLWDRHQQAEKIRISQEAKLSQMRQQVDALESQQAKNPDEDELQQIASIQKQSLVLRDRLASSQTQLAGPEKMTEILRDLIASNKKLELISLGTGETHDLLATGKTDVTASAATSAQNQRSLYQHEIIVTVRGDYSSLAQYVHAIEALPWKIHMGKLTLKSEHYPVSTMTLTLYTLSLERSWLSF